MVWCLWKFLEEEDERHQLTTWQVEALELEEQALDDVERARGVHCRRFLQRWCSELQELGVALGEQQERASGVAPDFQLHAQQPLRPFLALPWLGRARPLLGRGLRRRLRPCPFQHAQAPSPCQLHL